jgi:hypothetical protein
MPSAQSDQVRPVSAESVEVSLLVCDRDCRTMGGDETGVGDSAMAAVRCTTPGQFAAARRVQSQSKPNLLAKEI